MENALQDMVQRAEQGFVSRPSAFTYAASRLHVHVSLNQRFCPRSAFTVAEDGVPTAA